MEPFNSDERLFVFDKEKWKKQCEMDYSLPDPPTVTEVENGIILPLRKRNDVDVVEEAYEGGVCDKSGKFVAGMYRNLRRLATNRSCARSYSVPTESVVVRHETVIFGGLWYGSFPEGITESLTRLWYFADHPDTPYKFVFLHAHTFGDYIPYDLLEIAGLTKERMEIIEMPTQFDKIIVPQESIYIISNFRPGMGKFYDYIRSCVTPGSFKKIYLSREKLQKNGIQDVVNEAYFSDFYRRRGYEIVYPEQLTMYEQISILAGAEDIVVTQGTLTTYAALFCQPGARIVCLCRSKGLVHMFAYLQGRGVDYYVIDAYLGFLPAETNGVYFLGPTVYWKQYLDQRKIPYEPEEVSIDLHVKPFIYDYIARWAEWYFKFPSKYKNIHNKNLIDLIEDINNRLLQRSIDRSQYPDRDDVMKLKKQYEQLVEQYDKLLKKNTILENIIKSALGEHIQKTQDLIDKLTLH